MSPSDAFDAFLDAALHALAREAPSRYARLAALAGADGVRLAIDGPPLTLRFGARRHSLEQGLAPAAVHVRSDRATLLALLDAELTLLEAIERGRLQLEGAADAVLRCEQALGAFLDGAARAPSFTDLLAAFRGGA